MVAWREARSLRVALAELNKRAPNRSKASDGSIGDAAHATRDSDHNPWVDDPTSSVNVVTARDFTHDPLHNANMDDIFEAMRKRAKAGKMPWLKYLIRRWKIASKKTNWVWVKYQGTNGHIKHGHASVQSTYPLYDTTKAWGILGVAVTVPAAIVFETYKTGVVAGSRIIKQGNAGDDVKRLQTILKITADGYFGAATTQAVKAWQTAHNVAADGIVGTATWGMLLPPPVVLVAVQGRMPILRAGMKDPVVSGMNYVMRLQRLLGIKVTGTYDAATVTAVKAYNLRYLHRTVNGRSVDAAFWLRIIGIK